jgi:spore coat protein U-like protein
MRLKTAILGAALTAGTLVLAPAQATAQGTSSSKQANLRVTAQVVGNCIVTTQDIAFGNYDPVGANASAPLDAVGAVLTTCTPGTAPTITLDMGQHAQGSTWRLANGASFLPYVLYIDRTYAISWQGYRNQLTASTSIAQRSTAVAGRIPQAQSVPEGNYSDTVLVTVRF